MAQGCGCGPMPPDVLEELTRPRATVASASDGVVESAYGPGRVTHPIATERLMRYWTTGKGGRLKIRWGTPCDFCACLSQLRKYVKRPDYLKGLCANLHKRALGTWPGREHKTRRKGNRCPC